MEAFARDRQPADSKAAGRRLYRPGIARHDPCEFPQALYVHLPFCRALCTYCDFAREVYSGARAARYNGCLERELETKLKALSPQHTWSPRTIFLGGGTPSMLDLDELNRFFDVLERHVDTAHAEEFTIEANPGSTDGPKLELLLRRGVNRISFGVQTFRPHLLQLLGRVHGADQGREALRLARRAGFANCSVDLMHGLPTQSLDDLRRDLEEALQLGTQHVSAYGLIYEEGTPLTEAARTGRVTRLTPEEEADHYRTVMEVLDAGGLPMYEISNYARPDFEARHNLVYWRNEAYLGIGVGAAEYVGGARSINHKGMDAYMAAVGREGAAVASTETLDPEARAREALVLALRLRQGVDPAAFSARWGLNLASGETAERFAFYEKEGLMERVRGRWRIARAGLPVADGLLSELV